MHNVQFVQVLDPTDYLLVKFARFHLLQSRCKEQYRGGKLMQEKNQYGNRGRCKKNFGRVSQIYLVFATI